MNIFCNIHGSKVDISVFIMLMMKKLKQNISGQFIFISMFAEYDWIFYYFKISSNKLCNEMLP